MCKRICDSVKSLVWHITGLKDPHSKVRVLWLVYTTKGTGLALSKYSQKEFCGVFDSLSPFTEVDFCLPDLHREQDSHQSPPNHSEALAGLEISWPHT